jgi:hypothetical protein
LNMGEREISFIFGNYNGYKQTWRFPPEVSIKEMKFRMLKDQWPEHLVNSHRVVAMKLIYCGKLLEDDRKLGEY